VSSKIKNTIQEGVLTIILNNPEKLNCIGFEMLYAFQEALSTAEEDNDIKVVVITGEGEKSFSAGGDIKEFSSLQGNEIDRWIEDGNHIFNQLERIKKPTVALINGYALGGGLELALACDFRLALPHSKIGSPELRNGWLPGWGGMTRLHRLVGEAQAKRIVMLSEHFDTTQALRMGLITQILSEDWISEYEEFIAKLKELSPKMVALAKTALTDKNRTTEGEDIQFDIKAVKIARDK
jgi:enoyl-CoA hydratase/carnithine racemase